MSKFESGNGAGGRTEKAVRKPKKGCHNYVGKCDIRLDAKEDSMLNHLAELNGVTRSDVMRRALRDYFKFNTGEDE